MSASVEERSRSPLHLKELVSSALAKIPIATFHDLPNHKVIEILGDSSIVEALELLSQHNIFSAPVRNPNASERQSWSERYIGLLDYGSIILWVLEQADLSKVALAVGSATAAGLSAGAVGALGALAAGATGPGVVVGLTVAAVGAAIAGGVAVDKAISKDAPSTVNAIGEGFYKILLQEEPFKSMKVLDIVKSYRWTPFVPIERHDCMLNLLVLLSKYKLRSIPVVDVGSQEIKNYITQSAVVRGLRKCKGRDWFDEIASRKIFELGLPVMGPAQVFSIEGEKLVLEAFRSMKENKVGGLPVLDSKTGKIIGNISLRDIQYLLLKADLFANHKTLTVMEFLQTLSSGSESAGCPRMTPAITCKADVKLVEIIDTLCDKRIHRIYVVDDHELVMGVITLRDIISCFVVEPSGFADQYFGGSFKRALSVACL